MTFCTVRDSFRQIATTVQRCRTAWIGCGGFWFMEESIPELGIKTWIKGELQFVGLIVLLDGRQAEEIVFEMQ